LFLPLEQFFSGTLDLIKNKNKIQKDTKLLKFEFSKKEKLLKELKIYLKDIKEKAYPILELNKIINNSKLNLESLANDLIKNPEFKEIPLNISFFLRLLVKLKSFEENKPQKILDLKAKGLDLTSIKFDIKLDNDKIISIEDIFLWIKWHRTVKNFGLINYKNSNFYAIDMQYLQIFFNEFLASLDTFINSKEANSLLGGDSLLACKKENLEIASIIFVLPHMPIYLFSLIRILKKLINLLKFKPLAAITSKTIYKKEDKNKV
jgi:hypothetical protein